MLTNMLQIAKKKKKKKKTKFPKILILAVSWVTASLHNFSRMAKGSL
jgi:hypothetical protein